MKTAADAPARFAMDHRGACGWAEGFNEGHAAGVNQARAESLKPTAPHSRKATSKAAAERVQYKLAGTRARVLDYIINKGFDGATGSELAYHLRLNLYTAKPRCTELAAAGFITDSGRTRANTHGNQEIVWISAGTVA